MLLAGCGTGQHDDAVVAVGHYLSTHGRSGAVHCTSGVGLPYRLRTPDYLCVASRAAGSCDEYRATKRAGRWDVRLYRQDVDCVLPA